MKRFIYILPLWMRRETGSMRCCPVSKWRISCTRLCAESESCKPAAVSG